LKTAIYILEIIYVPVISVASDKIFKTQKQSVPSHIPPQIRKRKRKEKAQKLFG